MKKLIGAKYTSAKFILGFYEWNILVLNNLLGD